MLRCPAGTLRNRETLGMKKFQNMRSIPAPAAIESVLSIVSTLISLVNAVYNLIMKIFFGITF